MPKNRSRWDSNPQSPAPEASALSIRPREPDNPLSSSSVAGSWSSDYNPYEGFDTVKAAYTKKRGDEATATQLENAYDKIMMAQLTRWKQGKTFGSFEIFEKLKAFEPPVSPTFTAIKFLCCCMHGYTGILNLIEGAGVFIPRLLYDNQPNYKAHINQQTAQTIRLLNPYTAGGRRRVEAKNPPPPAGAWLFQNLLRLSKNF
ncbi:hypothetical protein ACH5RR_016562 [Cinchona calisaya]|uniref:Uncharacterized protein n=1 Tax=Cinchona calisaya TaxID=153742 RepID=A0ABD3A1W3_9GENT